MLGGSRVSEADKRVSMQRLNEFRARLSEIYGCTNAAAAWESMQDPKRQAYWLNPLIERRVDFEPIGVDVPGLDAV